MEMMHMNTMNKEVARRIVDSLNDVLRNVPLREGLEKASFREFRAMLEADGRWGIMVDDIKFKGRQLWGRVKLVSTDDPAYIEMVECFDEVD